MNMTKTIRVGIIGAGTNTKLHHIPGLQAIDGVEVARVCNRTRESSQSVADKFGIAGIADNWRDITNADDIDAVLIGTWPYMHHPMTVAALENDKHVLCEARMAMNSSEARAMLAAHRRRSGRIAMVVPSPFTLGIDRTIQRLIGEGFLGEIVSIDVRGLAGEFSAPGEPIHWRERRELSGNNVLSLGIWYEAILRWVGEAKRVIGLGKTVYSPKPDEGTLRSITVPDHLDVTAEMYCGAQLHLQLSSVATQPDGPAAILYGTDGVLQFAHNQLSGMQRGDAQLTPIPIPETEHASWRVEEEFIGAIRGVETVRLTTFEDGVRYMEFTDAVYESMRTGAVITLPFA
jgi:predicted dehydrogenase